MLTILTPQVEQLKKQKQKKAGTKKEEKQESALEVSKDDAPDTIAETASAANGSGSPEEDGGDGKDPNKIVPEPTSDLPQRQPSLSLQSKMRSSSFRQSSGGPLSPSYGFSPEGDTAPDIHRKQAARIEELEKENKRLAKDANEGERRLKKAEEELEDLREAEDDSMRKSSTAASPRSSAELEKLVRYIQA